MNADWFQTMDRWLDHEHDFLSPDEAEIAAGIWESVEKGMNPIQRKPHAAPEVIVREINDRQGAYYVLKNNRTKTYMRLSPEEQRLFLRMDGETGLEELIFEHFVATNNFAPKLVANLVEQLYQHNMLTETPIAVWRQLNQIVQTRSWAYRLSAPARIFLTKKLSISGLDRFITWFYRKIGWSFFSRPVKFIFVIISVLGVVAFGQLASDPRYAFLEDEIVTGLALLWLAAILPLVIHELGHALTVKHFGREVPRGGLMLFFGMPAAFVETTDIWLESKRARLTVTWNGPYTGLILGGAASILIYSFPFAAWNSMLFKMAGIAYLMVFMNVNPLLKLDGYYLLSDILNIPSLRERSFAFVREQLIGKVVQGKSFTRYEWIYTAFGLLSMAWTVYAVYLISFFWQTRLRTSLQALFGDGYSIIARGLSLLIILGIASVVVLLLLGIVQLVSGLVSRFLHTGILERHLRLALIGAGFAVAVGLLIPFIPLPHTWLLSSSIGLLAALLAAEQVFRINQPYRGSPRGLAQLVILIALCLAGLLSVFPVIVALRQYVDWLLVGLVASLLTSGMLLIWLPFRRLSLLQMVLGVLFGGTIFVILNWFTGSGLTDLKILGLVALVVVGSWSIFCLWGSARAPAVFLIFLGGIMILLARFDLIPFEGLSLAGTLLMAAGGLHLSLARLPRLSSYEIPKISSQTSTVIRHSVGNLVRRVISQVFFETGWRGVIILGQEFTRTMKRNGVDLSITANHFEDKKLQQRSVDELTYVYGLAFDELHKQVSEMLGRGMGTLAFAYGIDLLPWQYREVVSELILSRQPWGLALNQDVVDAKIRSRKVLRRVPLFVNCSDEELSRIAENLEIERFAAGKTIIRQGDRGDKFYIIESGNVSIWQLKPDGEEEFVVKAGSGQYFGEIALVTNAPRNATVRAETPVSLLSLRKRDFDRLVRQYVNLSDPTSTNVRYSWLLRGMPIFDGLDSYQLDQLVERLQTERFKTGEVVVRTGDPGDKFYIVESGELIVAQENNGEMVEISRRGPGEYVGEIALLQTQARTATLIAAEDTTLLSLQAEQFQELVSNFLEVGHTLALTSSRRLTFLDIPGGQQA
jgi:putative peptide zinc metalloprotease protein